MTSSALRSDREPVLITIGGLPATGKTAVARALAGSLRAAYVRIDSIEAALGRAEGRFEATNGWETPPGYDIGRAVAIDQIHRGLDVVAESVNPGAASRDAWRDAGLEAGARVIEVEIVCSDPVEHRRRAAVRVLDIIGLIRPTWKQITERDYDEWDREHVVLDTAVLGVDDAVRLLHAEATD